MKKTRKVAIIVRDETSKTCVGKGCLNAFYKKIDSFEKYQDQDLELVAFCNDDGISNDPIENIHHRIEKFKKIGVDIVHVSTCIRAKSPIYNEMLELFSREFEVVGYTHGSAFRKKNGHHSPHHH
jgi:predicted metal-binding protein